MADQDILSTFSSLSELKNEDPSTYADGNLVYLLGFNAPNDGAEGTFYWDAGSTESEVTGIIVLPNSLTATDPGRWKRLHNKNEVNVLWTGTTDGSNSAVEIQEAIDYAGSFTQDMEVVFPAGIDYRTNQTISCEHSNVNLKMYGRLTYTATDENVILIVGPENTSLRAKRRDHFIRVFRETLPADWSNESCVGVRIYNTEMSRIEIKEAIKSTVNVDILADNSEGFVYNDIYLGNLRDGQKQILLRNANGGWVNQNTFYGGRLWNTSDTKPNLDRWGIVIRSDDGVYPRNNNNLFIQTNIELKEENAQAFPIRLEDDSRQNYFYRPRLEGTTKDWQLLDSVTENILELGLEAANGEDDQSAMGNNYVRFRRELYDDFLNNSVLIMNDLATKANYWDSSKVYVDNLSWGISANANVLAAVGSVTIENDYISIPDLTRILGTFINTENAKDFVVKKEVADGLGGRVVIRCYDGNGNVMSDPNAVKDSRPNSLTFFSDYSGGSFRDGSDSEAGVYFEVSDAVKKVWVGLTGGTNELRLRAFSINTRSNSHANAYPGHGEAYGFGKRADSVVAGAYEVGDIVWNASPAGGGTVGWVCTSAGEFGTATEPVFKEFGTIAT